MINAKVVKKVKPYVGVVAVQFGFAGFALIAKAALNHGSCHYTFSVYRNAFAAAIFSPFALVFERNMRPRMTFRVFSKILLLAILDPIIGQNLFYGGVKYSSPTFISAMCNLLPAITFLLAWILRIEKVNLKKVGSHAKIMGTLVTVGGAMMMTLMSGSPVIQLPWTHHHDNVTKSRDSDHSPNSTNYEEDPIKGALLITASNVAYSLFYILQAITLNSYPAALSLTAMVCSLGALLGVMLTFAAERGNMRIWALRWDAKLLAYAYGGIISSGLTYYISGVIIKEKGPVFFTAFNPLNLIIVAVLSTFIFAEQMTVGKVSGTMIIVIGLYMVVWGKSKDEKRGEKIEQQDKQAATDSSTKDEQKDVLP